MLKNAWLCFRISSSFVCNNLNPSPLIHSFSENQGKCKNTCNRSISDFSTILTSDILILADSSHLPSDEAYRQRLSLPCYRLQTPCYECTPNARHCFDKCLIKACFCWGEMGLFCHMTSGRLSYMISYMISCNYDIAYDIISLELSMISQTYDIIGL